MIFQPVDYLSLSRLLRVAVGVCTISILVGFSTVPASQPEPANALTSRLLSKLNPAEPESYLLAGEELGARSQTDEDRAIAIQTLARGLGLASRSDQRELAASLCIAIASFESDMYKSTALWDLALILDPSRHAAWVIHRDAQAQVQRTTTRLAAQGLYAARFHDPQTVQSVLSQQAVRNTIRQAATHARLDVNRIDQLIDEMIRDAKNDPCKGQVFVRQRVQGEVRWVICADPHQPIGTSFSEESFSMLVQLELLLLDEQSLSSESTPWDATGYFNQTQPAIDPSVGSFMTIYSVDLSKPVWQSGDWVSSR